VIPLKGRKWTKPEDRKGNTPTKSRRESERMKIRRLTKVERHECHHQRDRGMNSQKAQEGEGKSSWGNARIRKFIVTKKRGSTWGETGWELRQIGKKGAVLERAFRNT